MTQKQEIIVHYRHNVSVVDHFFIDYDPTLLPPVNEIFSGMVGIRHDGGMAMIPTEIIYSIGITIPSEDKPVLPPVVPQPPSDLFTIEETRSVMSVIRMLEAGGQIFGQPVRLEWPEGRPYDYDRAKFLTFLNKMIGDPW